MNRELIFENTWVVEDSGVRIFILRGTEKTLVIDTGRSGLDIRGCLEDDQPSELLNTHADGDHIAGNRFFPVFFMHPSEAPVYYKLNKGEGSFLPVYDGDQMDLGGRPAETRSRPTVRSICSAFIGTFTAIFMDCAEFWPERILTVSIRPMRIFPWTRQSFRN